MKVLILRTNGDVVKINNYNLQEIGIAKALIRRGIQCDIVYFCGKDKSHEEYINFDEKHRIKIYWRSGISLLGNAFFFKLQDLLEEYDVIQVCEYDQMTSRHIAFFSKYKKKCVMTHGPYSNDTNKKYNLKCAVIDKLWLPRQQKKKICVFAKSYYAKDFLENRGFENIVVTGVGLDSERFSVPDVKNDNTKRILEFVNDSFFLLYIGQITDRRSIKFMVELVFKLKNSGVPVKLAMIGSGPDKYVNECKELITSLNLWDDIIYEKSIAQPQIPYLYDTADVFLLPSKYEIFGMVLLEAMFFSVPVITTDNGGSSVLVDNEHNGFTLPLDVHKWEETLMKLNSNKMVASDIGSNAHEKIVTEYSWDAIVDKMIPEYNNVLGEVFRNRENK